MEFLPSPLTQSWVRQEKPQVLNLFLVRDKSRKSSLHKKILNRNTTLVSQIVLQDFFCCFTTCLAAGYARNCFYTRHDLRVDSYQKSIVELLAKLAAALEVLPSPLTQSWVRQEKPQVLNLFSVCDKSRKSSLHKKILNRNTTLVSQIVLQDFFLLLFNIFSCWICQQLILYM